MALRGHHLSRDGRVGGLQVARKSSWLPVKGLAEAPVKASTATPAVPLGYAGDSEMERDMGLQQAQNFFGLRLRGVSVPEEYED